MSVNQIDELARGFSFSSVLAVDAPAFLRHHGKAGVAEHIIQVAAQAERIALQVGADRDLACRAAYLHDISLVMPYAEMVAAAEQAGLAILQEERQAPFLLHGKLSGVFATHLFGVDDPAVLGAMACHSTLRAGATMLDQVLFIADKLSWDPAHAPYHADLSAALDRSLADAVHCFLTWAWGERHTFVVVHPWLTAACAERGIA